jgi:hypothetical protein
MISDLDAVAMVPKDAAAPVAGGTAYVTADGRINPPSLPAKWLMYG